MREKHHGPRGAIVPRGPRGSNAKIPATGIATLQDRLSGNHFVLGRRYRSSEGEVKVKETGESREPRAEGGEANAETQTSAVSSQRSAISPEGTALTPHTRPGLSLPSLIADASMKIGKGTYRKSIGKGT